ncbi:hypothetical protein A3Q56_02120 [Intoshia linei]|uniref:Uncharacterized protein n=1 Tax=Intoshia linei TaxID=1819745 RepID=A0A177B906_9BILA|nr:hypothetical protein A3Q56_02120 [Intoshia linei]
MANIKIIDTGDYSYQNKSTIDKLTGISLDVAGYGTDCCAKLMKQIMLVAKKLKIKCCTECLDVLCQGILLQDSLYTVTEKYSDCTIWMLNGNNNCCLKHTILNSFLTTHAVYNMFGCPKTCIANAQMNTIVMDGILDIFQSFSPFSKADGYRLKRAADFSRSFTSMFTLMEKVSLFMARFIDYTMNAFTELNSVVPNNVADWVNNVSKVEVIYCESDVFLSNKEAMSKFVTHRKNIYDLYKQGKIYLAKFELLPQQSFIAKLVLAKVKALEKIINQCLSLYIGNDRKDKPLLIYLYGKAGIGKTVCINHVFTDVFAALNRKLIMLVVINTATI